MNLPWISELPIFVFKMVNSIMQKLSTSSPDKAILELSVYWDV